MRSSKLFISIILIISTIIGGIIFYLYSTISYKKVDLFTTVPEESVVAILKVKSFNHLEMTLYDSTVAHQQLFNNFLLNKSSDIFTILEKNIFTVSDTVEFKDFKSRSFLISSHLLSDSTVQFMYTFSIKNRSESRRFFSILEERGLLSVDDLKSKANIFSISLNRGFPLYFYANEGVIFLSHSKSLLSKSIKQQYKEDNILSSPQFSELVKVSKNNDFDNLFINTKRFKDLGIRLLSSDWKEHLSLFPKSSNWIQYDIDYKQRQLTFNGIFVTQNDSTFTKLFQGGISTISLDSVYPASVSAFFNYTFDSTLFRKYYKKLLLSSNLKLSSGDIDGGDFFVKNSFLFDLYLGGINSEFGLIQLKGDSSKLNKVFFQKVSKSFFSTIETLQSEVAISPKPIELWNIDDDLRLPIYNGLPTPFFHCFYSPFLSSLPSHYMIVFEDYAVFADDISVLKKVYKDYILGNTLSNNLIYKSYRLNFPDQENLFIYSLFPKGSFLGKFNKPIQTDNSKFNIFGSQLAYSDSVAYTSIVINYDVKLRDFGDLQWKSFLDTVVSTPPKAVIDPKDGSSYIMVQDAKNQLYLINDIGRIIWKRPLDGRVIGDINQFYLKGKAQNSFIFNTIDKIYQIDLNSNHIGNFPVLLPFKATTSVSIFDYEQNGEFRLFIPSKDKEILVYDRKGNLVTGFQTVSLSGEVYSPIQHFQTDGKDYIVLTDATSNRILDRKGNTRVMLSREFDRNEDSPFYLFSQGKKSFFVTSDKECNLVKIDLGNGQVSNIKALDSPSTHHMLSFDIDKRSYFVFLTNRRLKLITGDGDVIFDKPNEVSQVLDAKIYGNQSNGFYLSFMDKSSSLIYLFDLKSGNLVEGFPKNGDHNYSLKFLKDGTLRIYSGTNDNSIICF